MIAFLPGTKKFVTMRVLLPRGSYTRSMGGLIADPEIIWKGCGICAGKNERLRGGYSWFSRSSRTGFSLSGFDFREWRKDQKKTG